MPKKVITGSSKLLEKTKDQILPGEDVPEENPEIEEVEKLVLRSNRRPDPKMKTYRFKETDIERLQKIIDGVNNLRPVDEPITEIAVIKALLLWGSRTKSDQMLKLIKEAL